MKTTKRMAQAMEEELKIKLTPVGEMNVTHFAPRAYDLYFDLVYTNKGNFFLKIHSYKIKCWDVEHPNEPIDPIEKIVDVFVIPGDKETIPIKLPLEGLYKKFTEGIDQKIRLAIELSVKLFNAKNDPFYRSLLFHRTFP